jgi:cellulase/cellobiase CelA1
VRNTGKSPAQWTVIVPAVGKIYNSWSSTLQEKGGNWVFTGVEWNSDLSAGQETEFGFCANK